MNNLRHACAAVAPCGLRHFSYGWRGVFAVGFGTAYAGGCTSGHAIPGLADGWLRPRLPHRAEA